MREISDKEFERVHACLKLWTDSVFADMWKIHGRMVFSKKFTHAAVVWSKGTVRIHFNPSYWKRISKYQRIFVICHEFCHLLFGHIGSYKDLHIDEEWLNVAQDIQINEYLREKYPILMTHFRGKDNISFIETVFRQYAHLISKDEGYLYYYCVIESCLKKK